MKLFHACLGMALLMFSGSCLSEVAIVVHPSNTADLSTADISRIYLGKLKSFPGGGSAIALDMQEGTPERDAFVKQILNKSESQLKAYWSKLVFSGQGQPPKIIDDSSEIIKLVSSNPNMIGFVNASAVDANVRVISTF